jgi:hypothetical protein
MVEDGRNFMMTWCTATSTMKTSTKVLMSLDLKYERATWLHHRLFFFGKNHLLKKNYLSIYLAQKIEKSKQSWQTTPPKKTRSLPTQDYFHIESQQQKDKQITTNITNSPFLLETLNRQTLNCHHNKHKTPKECTFFF